MTPWKISTHVAVLCVAFGLGLSASACSSSSSKPGGGNPEAGAMTGADGGGSGGDAAKKDGGVVADGACTGDGCGPMKCPDGGCKTVVDSGPTTNCGVGKAQTCGTGGACTSPADCTNQVCTDKVCVAPSPTDTKQNDSETDMDCGGGLLASGAPNPASDGAQPCADTKKCLLGNDCTSLVCAPGPVTGVAGSTGAPVDCGAGQTCTCQPVSPTDGVVNDSETDIDCGGGFSDDVGTVNPASDGAPTCQWELSQKCLLGSDCDDGVCNANQGAGGPPIDCPAGATCQCQPPSSNDGVTNGGETDVDCGGDGTPGNDSAPPCQTGMICAQDIDCFWGHCNSGVCGGHVAGTQDGDETDVDCGGTQSPGCDWFKVCFQNSDCASQICDNDCSGANCFTAGQCLPGSSCQGVKYGGTTCGTGEDLGSSPSATNYETCCRTLPVTGFTDATQPGKTVYLDKYEITAGRMRAFINSLGNTPNVQGYMAAHRPTFWNVEWENILPQDVTNSLGSFTIVDPTVDLNYPGEDQYNINGPTQSSWSVINGQYTVDFGLYNALGNFQFFPEYYAIPADWPGPDMGASYAAQHNLNCSNADGSYGYGTYWFDDATIATYGAGVGKAFTKEEDDEKALNCTPFGLFAAFCAWDGGQLATMAVSDYISGTVPSADNFPPIGSQDGQFSPGYNGGNNCGPAGMPLNSFGDGTQSCDTVYNYPYPDDGNEDYDGSARIAPPGRVPTDAIRLTGAAHAGDEPWMDMIGNLLEGVFQPDMTRFTYRGYGAAWSSVQHHRNQQTTARFKEGSFGARCMRFK
jgi:hypothetical protein